MIGSRILAAATLTALAVVLGGGAPRPEIARGADATIVAEADRTLAAIDLLEARLAPAVDAARIGAARVVAGGEDPAEPMATGAERLLDAAPALAELRDALGDLEAARRARRPEADPLPPAPDGGGLASIAAQLRESGESGARFAETRLRAEGLAAGLVEALDAAADGQTEEASERLRTGLAAVEEMREWQDLATVLAVWIDTADAMIRAMQRLIDAVAASDSEAASAARADFDAAAAGATDADRALRIGLSEAGSSLTAVPVGRLTGILVSLEELEAAVRAARAEVGG